MKKKKKKRQFLYFFQHAQTQIMSHSVQACQPGRGEGTGPWIREGLQNPNLSPWWPICLLQAQFRSGPKCGFLPCLWRRRCCPAGCQGQAFVWINQQIPCIWASQVAKWIKNLPATQEMQVWSLDWEDLLEEGMATHSSILAWEIPWTQAGCSP